MARRAEPTRGDVARAGVTAGGCLAWALAVIFLGVSGILGARLPAWAVAACSVASFGVGYAACGLLNHRP
jgi:hypothetical protein